MNRSPLPNSARLTFTAMLLVIAVALIGMFPNSAFAYDRRIALLIGLAKYETGQNKGIFRDLPYVANDLLAVAKALRALDFDEIYIYSDVKAPSGSQFEFITPLRANENVALPVSKGHVEKLLLNQLSRLQNDGKSDLLLVYFTGHGGIFGESERVLAAPESEVDLPGSFSRVRELLNNMADAAPTTDKILVIDACADRLGPRGQDFVTRSEEVLPTYLYSSKLGEASFYDDSLKMSVFTKHFVEALARADELGNGNANGKLESEEVRRYVYERVPLHGSVRQEKRPPPPNTPRIQNPIGSSTHNLVLAEIKVDPTVPRPGPGATDAEIERYLRSLREAHYGSVR